MKKTRKILCFTLALLMLLPWSSAYACTVMAVGKDASADGSVMVAHSCDGARPQLIQVHEGGKHAAGETVKFYKYGSSEIRGEIPQVAETYTWFEGCYPHMNDKGINISEQTWTGRDEMFNSEGLFNISDLAMLGLQRTSTARDCVRLMGELAEKYGYNDGGECLPVADKNEAWVFEICGPGADWTPGCDAPGAHWAARRVPDDEVYASGNRSNLGEIDFNDTENWMWSTDITALPERMGWWKQGDPFVYYDMFNPEPFGYTFYASRREWRIYSLLCPSRTFEPVDRYNHYDFSVKPDSPVSLQNIMDIYSDHMEGTKYDLTQGLAAGPFHSPVRWSLDDSMKPENRKDEDWEREIALDRTGESVIGQCREWLPDEIGTVLWFGCDSPDTTVFVPIYAGTSEIPEEWSAANRSTFNLDYAGWAFNFVNNYANLCWDRMYPEIRARKAVFEEKFFAEQEKTDEEAKALYDKDPAEAKKYLTKYVCDNMDKVAEDWWDLAGDLVFKYYDGKVHYEDGHTEKIGYPTEWLEAVGFGDTSAADSAMLKGVIDEPEDVPPAPEADTGNPYSVVLAFIAGAGVAAVAFFIYGKKKRSGEAKTEN